MRVFNCRCAIEMRVFRNLGVGAIYPVWPGSKLLPTRNSPELIAMHASLGARMPYREAAFLLSGLLPCQRPCSYSTVRNHTLQVGARLDFEGMDRAVGPAPDGVDWASVAVDGTYVRGRRSEGCHRFHIVTGRFQATGGSATLFSFVQQFQPRKREMAQLWRALGCRDSTHLRVLTDGDRAMSHFVQASARERPATCSTGSTSQCVGRALRRSLWQCLWHAGYSRNETRIEERELESIRHHLWHGDIEHGCLLLGSMRNPDRDRRGIKGTRPQRTAGGDPAPDARALAVLADEQGRGRPLQCRAPCRPARHD